MDISQLGASMEHKLKGLTVFIGRFSPFHNGHAAVLKRALQTSKAVLVLVGSSGQARNTKNPFTFEERAQMVRNYADRVIASPKPLLIKPIYDHPYNDQAWIRGVQEAVDSACNELVDVIGLNPDVHLTGADRDKTTWYLHTFGDMFEHDLVKEHDYGFELSATQVRDALFGKKEIASTKSIPQTTYYFLEDFLKNPAYEGLVREYEFIERYKKAWEAAPYAPTFVTVDTCVIQSGHVLVNVRDNFPGVGLWALPGGFLEQDEKTLDGAIRELQEETRIELSKAQLYGAVRSKEIFDHPDRSLRGRTITTCYLLKLDDSKPLPKVRPQKGEVKKCEWIPINEALSQTDRWFEDHWSILQTMVGRV